MALVGEGSEGVWKLEKFKWLVWVCGSKVYIVVFASNIIGDGSMVGKYSRMWFKVHEIVSRAQKEIYNVVEEICRMVSADLAPFLEELRRDLEFTYVIEPLQGDGDIMRCVPCLYIEASPWTYVAVKRAVREKFSEMISEARLVFVRRPAQPKIEGL